MGSMLSSNSNKHSTGTFKYLARRKAVSKEGQYCPFSILLMVRGQVPIAAAISMGHYPGQRDWGDVPNPLGCGI